MGVASILMFIFVVFSAKNVKNENLISNNIFGKIMLDYTILEFWQNFAQK